MSSTPIFDLVGSASEWMLDASVQYPTDGVTRCVDCVRSRAWSLTAGRATLGYTWNAPTAATSPASTKRQGDGLLA